MFKNKQYMQNKPIIEFILCILKKIIKLLIINLFIRKSNDSSEKRTFKTKNIKLIFLCLLTFFLGNYWCSYPASPTLQNCKLTIITSILVLFSKELLDNALTSSGKKEPILYKQALLFGIAVLCVLYILIFLNIISDEDHIKILLMTVFPLGLGTIVSSIKKI